MRHLAQHEHLRGAFGNDAFGRMAARDQLHAEFSARHAQELAERQEKLLEENTRLTEEVHRLSAEIHARVVQA